MNLTQLTVFAFVSIHLLSIFADFNSVTPQVNTSNSQQVATEFTPPDTEEDNNREGSGSRTGCPAVTKPLTAIIPNSKIDLTLSAYPTFWVYVPYQSNGESQAEFILLDDQEEAIFKEKITLSGTPGIIKFKLPQNAPALEVGKIYYWQFAFICNPQIRAEDDYVQGAIQRVTPTAALINQLEQSTTPLEQIEVYAQNKFWYETLTMLGSMRQEKPQDPRILKEWKELLTSIGLENLVEEPIISQD
ncbi:DUF928 domain-containing protein [Planktothrix sp. FACHB-1365]|uniref:DUF928 domain-containing protein n=1 Tax=Planktothrix sp. FACHB-1365 TaxID=2692855 RepID=UPI001686BF40|nr:DUF928 domain-containing protein [Planktothrix sp. FACHB-1365]MBD2481389.1 DUF928 domain-containing protein [Planktothrix sp. FACHB-1365]